MDNKVERTKRDRELFTPGGKQKLMQVVQHGNPRHVTEAIIKILKSQLILEEYQRTVSEENFDQAVNKFTAENIEFIDRELEKSIHTFIGSILSKEG